MPDAKDRGLYEKYHVERTDGKPIEYGCIVLEFDDPNTWAAIDTWATQVGSQGYEALCKDVRERLRGIVRIMKERGVEAPPAPSRVDGAEAE